MGGDPTELMRICIENGTFTVSFLKEGMNKVSVCAKTSLVKFKYCSSFVGG